MGGKRQYGIIQTHIYKLIIGKLINTLPNIIQILLDDSFTDLNFIKFLMDYSKYFVSVIVNCHNGEKFISRSIESILNQSHTKKYKGDTVCQYGLFSCYTCTLQCCPD